MKVLSRELFGQVNYIAPNKGIGTLLNIFQMNQKSLVTDISDRFFSLLFHNNRAVVKALENTAPAATVATDGVDVRILLASLVSFACLVPFRRKGNRNTLP